MLCWDSLHSFNKWREKEEDGEGNKKNFRPKGALLIPQRWPDRGRIPYPFCPPRSYLRVPSLHCSSPVREKYSNPRCHVFMAMMYHTCLLYCFIQMSHNKATNMAKLCSSPQCTVCETEEIKKHSNTWHQGESSSFHFRLIRESSLQRHRQGLW